MAVVAHVVDAELLRVAVDEEVLPVEVGDGDLLIAELQRVQAGVGVFLQPVEDGQVVLVAIGGVVAEDAHAEVRVVEDEAAEVAVERLRADADGDEVVVRREVAQLPFVEELLQREVAVGARRAAADVGLDEAVLAQMDVVEVADQRRFAAAARSA